MKTLNSILEKIEMSLYLRNMTWKELEEKLQFQYGNLRDNIIIDVDVAKMVCKFLGIDF